MAVVKESPKQKADCRVFDESGVSGVVVVCAVRRRCADFEQNAKIDEIGVDGTKVSITKLTHYDIVEERNRTFDGKICWYGFSEKFDYILGPRVLFHRRIVFKSPLNWPIPGVDRRDPNTGPEGDEDPGAYTIQPLEDVNGVSVSGCLRRMFAEHTIRGLFYGAVMPRGFTVLEDRRFDYNGREYGSVRAKKMWNGFGANKNGVVLKYKPSGTGQRYTGALEDSTDYQHIYVANLFHYGLGGLDVALPTHAEAQAVEAAAKMNATTLGESEPSGPGKKKIKRESGASEDSEMSGGWSDVHGVVGVQGGSDRCTVDRKLKLYWRPPK